MIEPVNYWTNILGGITLFLIAIRGLLEALGELMKWIPKPLIKFLTYSLTLVVPNIGIIWYFFYLAGLSPDRISEARFFWAIVGQPTLGVSLYAYIWGSWVYPQLQRILNESPSEKNMRKEDGGDSKNNLQKKSKSGQKPNR